MRVKIPITTDGSGAATVYSGRVSGTLEAIHIDLGTLAAGAADFTVTEEDTSAPIVTITNLAASARFPVRNQAVDAVGTAIAGQYVAPPVRGRIKVVVAGGGNAATGAIYLYVDGSVAQADAAAPRVLTYNL